METRKRDGVRGVRVVLEELILLVPETISDSLGGCCGGQCTLSTPSKILSEQFTWLFVGNDDN